MARNEWSDDVLPLVLRSLVALVIAIVIIFNVVVKVRRVKNMAVAPATAQKQDQNPADERRPSGSGTPPNPSPSGTVFRPSGGPTAAPRPIPSAPKDAMVGNGSDPEFRDEAPDGGLLVGFDVWYDTFAGYDVIGAVRPIYRTGTTEIPSQSFGKETKRGVRVLAKPGYAVGAVIVKSGAGIDALTVTFMKVVGTRLNPNDTYVTDKLGGPGGHAETKLGGDGTQIIGIIGRIGTNISGFGLAYRG